MKRREFIMLLGGAAVVWPHVLRAQQKKVQRIGALVLGNADADAFRKELREGLRKSGYVEGQSVLLDFRSAEGKADQLPKLAAELAAIKVDVIAAIFTPCVRAAQQATREIPIVVLASDAVESGLVTSLARPGGNITGVSVGVAELHGKCVELFRDMLPSVKRIGALGNAADPSSKRILEEVRRAGKVTGIEIFPTLLARGPDEIDTAFAAMKKAGAGAVVVQASLPTKSLAELALKHRLPAAAAPRSFAEVGGLMSYGNAESESFQRMTQFVIKILRGGKPADMPVEQPTKFELVVNLKTAKALDLKIAESFLLRADTVID